MSPTPLAPTPPDDDLEARLRSAFAARADEVRLADLDPDLPSGVRVSLEDREDGGRSPRGRARWVAIAAAVALVGAGIGLAARSGDDGATTTATAPESTTTTVPRSEVFASFPAGVDPAVGAPLFVTGVHSSPEADPDPDSLEVPAAEAAMGEGLAPFGDDVTEPMPTDLGLGSDTWSPFYSPTGAVDGDLWGAAADPDERGGVVVARPAPGGGWGVVAVTSEVIDVTGLVREGDLLRGEVRVSVRAPVRVVVSHARSDGRPPLEDQVTAAELTTTSTTEPGIDGSVLDLGDPGTPGGLGVDVGDGPIVVRVEVGDAPGQVGIDGVEVAALAAVGIPGAGGPGTDDTAAGATTTDPSSTTMTVPPTSTPPTPGVWTEDQVMWRPPAGEVEADGPVGVAALFVFEVLGEIPAWVGRPGATSGTAPTTVVEGDGGPTVVNVPLVSLVDIRVALVEIDGRWAVVQVGDGGVEVDTSGGGTSVGGVTIGGGEGSTLYVALRRSGDAWSVERGRLPDDPVSFEGADAVVVATIDPTRGLIAAQGNAL